MKTLIKNKKYLNQKIDFTGLENNNIHPSDIDAVLEFDNDVLILIEVKFKDAIIPVGQKYMLQNIVDSWHTGKAVVLKLSHNFLDDVQFIPLVECKVEEVYYKGVWQKAKISNFINHLNGIGEIFDCKKLKFEQKT